jgi:catechol 2,3-dioxygenase
VGMAMDAFFRSVQLDSVTLRVADLDRARRFYQDVLGFHAQSAPDGTLTFSTAPGGGALFELESSSSAPARQPDAAGLFHAALLFSTRESLGRMLKHLMRAGVRLGSADHGVSEALYLADPEGNALELYADRPPTAWPAADSDSQVAMFTDALDLASLAAAGGAAGPLLPRDVRIGHMHLAVSSLAQAEDFYRHRLGFAVRQRSSPGALFLARDGYHHHLGVNTWRSRTSATTGSLGLVRFGIRITEHEERERVVAATRDRAIGPGPHGGILLRDFDGIEVELLSRSK